MGVIRFSILKYLFKKFAMIIVHFTNTQILFYSYSKTHDDNGYPMSSH